MKVYRPRVKVCCIQNPDEAIEKIRPFGVDVCNGERSNGKLDPEKLKRFVNEIKGF
ncbi:MAG: hypothetical protein U9N86_09270 [Bacteroidota bacterium]|nr:hypothetical protein [Bacteroidota bacterium]